MGNWQIFDGTVWRNPCDCPIHVRDSNGNWKLIDPVNCNVKYFDGTNWCPIICNGVPLDDKTEINIWFDNSGSMNTTLPPLQEMRDTLLEACLLPIYNNDIALYNERVRILNMQNTGFWSFNERFIKCLGTTRNFDRTVDTTVTQVINLTFQDESDLYGYGQASIPFDNSTRTSGYDFDVAEVIANQTSEPYAIKGTAFRVSTGNNVYIGFRGLTEATFVNSGVYAPPYNLSNYTGINYNYELDVLPGSTAVYYKDLVIASLQNLGILVPNCP